MQYLNEQLDEAMLTAMTGTVVRVEGMVIAVAGLPAPLGAQVEITRQAGDVVTGEVIGFRDHLTLIYPLANVVGIRYGNQVRLRRTSRYVRVGHELLGRVIDSQGQPLDDLGSICLTKKTKLMADPPRATSRPRIDQALSTGVRAIDGMLTCGRGQRIGLFAGSGVGKSVTLGMMARNTAADVNVIALIGERGREVNDFLERDLGPEGRKKSVVVVATSDQPALVRLQAALVATSIAEYFRDDGNDVLLMMDSITRFAMAQREIGLVAGEPPTSRGYPPSVFAMLPKLVERAGRSDKGSITAFYTVLVEGDDTNEPVSDAVRGLLDGHIMLSRKLASSGHYPAIDVLESVSRLATEVTSLEQQQALLMLRSLLAAYRDHQDLISIGAYRTGSNPEVDVAVALKDELDSFLQQDRTEASSVTSAHGEALKIAQKAMNLRRMATQSSNQPAQAMQPTA